MTSHLDASGTETAAAPGRAAGDAAHYRYPGSPPFRDSELDRLLFKGRDREADEVFHSILSSDLFVLFALSGMGKTSLLNAGVLENLRHRGYWPVMLRMNTTDQQPIALIRNAVADAAARSDTVDLLDDPSSTVSTQDADNLWDFLSALEVWEGNTLLEPVLIFDQFEELFTLGWEHEAQRDFISQFGEVARGHRNERPADAGRQNGHPAVRPPVKLVIAIREDSIGELEAMATDVPQILRNRYRLERLDPAQARQAICEPALVEDPRLGTQRFAYSEDAADEILDFLGAKAGADLLSGRPLGVDPSQLQLVCQYVEHSILPRKQPPSGGARIEITRDDLGGRDGLDEILRDFYRRTVERFDGEEREHVRELCERRLINSSRRRVSRSEAEIIDEFHVTEAALADLVAERLVRGEHRVGLGTYYELAHDTLVEPILDYRARREAEALLAEQERKRRRNRNIAFASLAVAAVVAVVLAIIRPWDDPPEELTLGQPVEHTVSGEQTIDFTFDSKDERGLEVYVTPMPSTQPADPPTEPFVSLTVTRPDDVVRQIPILANGGPTSLILNGSEGAHRIVVAGTKDADGSFEIGVRHVDPITLPTGTPKQDAIEQPGEVEVFTITSADENAILIDVTPAAEFDVTFEVIAPDGSVTTRDDGIAGAVETASLRGLTGTYQVVVRGFQSSVGEFSIVSRKVVSLGIDEQIDDQRVDQGFVALYSIQSNGPQELNLSVRPAADLETAVRVTSTDGTVVAEVDAVDFGRAASLLLPLEEGEYRVTVTGFTRPERTAESMESFSIELTSIDVVALSVGSAEQGKVDTLAGAVFTVETAADQVVAVDVDPEAGIGVAVEVMGPADWTDRDDSTQEGHIASVLLRGPAGQYRIEVTGVDQAVGSFTISARDVEPIPLEIDAPALTASNAPEPGQPAIDDGRYAIFTIDRSAEQGLAVSITPGPDTAVTVELTAPDGSAQPTLGFGGGVAAFVLGSEGTFELVVRAFDRSAGTATPVLSFNVAVEELRLERLDADSGRAEVLRPGVGVSSFVVEPSTDDSVVALDVIPTSAVDLAVQVTTPADAPRFFTVPAGAPQSIPLIGQPGYLVLVAGFGEAEGEYLIGWREVDILPLEPGTSRSGRIEEPVTEGVFAAYALAVTGAADLVVTATPVEPGDAGFEEPPTDLVLEVVPPSGASFQIDDSASGPEQLFVDAPEEGRWIVVVRGFQGSTGDFEIRRQ